MVIPLRRIACQVAKKAKSFAVSRVGRYPKGDYWESPATVGVALTIGIREIPYRAALPERGTTLVERCDRE